MSWKIWKKPDERANEEFNKGHEKGLNLSDWNSAFSHFNSAHQLYQSAGNLANAQMAFALAAFSRALSQPDNLENWNIASEALKTLGNIQINITVPVLTELLAQECYLKVDELKARKNPSLIQKAEQLEEIAKKYLSIGGCNLLVPLLLEKKRITGQSKAHTIIADAARLRGDEVADLDPKKAGEFYKMAAVHMKTAGDLGSFRNFSEMADSSSMAAQCYFCGREVQGKEINFVYMKANLTRFLSKKTEGQILPSTSPPASVVACQGCHSAITIAADEIAKKYFDILEAKLTAAIETIDQRIERIVQEINNLNGRINRLERRG